MAGVQVGFKDIHYAILTTDEPGKPVVYETPKKLARAIEGTLTPTMNTETLYADDAPAEVAEALGEITLELNVDDLTPEVLADLLGHTLNDEGVLVKNKDDFPPYLAVGFRALKSNGKYRYVWLYKGKFTLPEQGYKTKEDTPEFQTPSITANFIVRDADGNWQVQADEDTEGFTPIIADNWFNAVYEEGK